MKLWKIMLAVFLAVSGSVNVFAKNINIAVELTGVTLNGGNVHFFVFSNEQDYKKDIRFKSFTLESTNSVLSYILDLPEGDNLISAFQDTNGNGKNSICIIRLILIYRITFAEETKEKDTHIVPILNYEFVSLEHQKYHLPSGGLIFLKGNQSPLWKEEPDSLMNSKCYV